MAIEDWIDCADVPDEDQDYGFETQCSCCGKTIRMMYMGTGWRPFDKYGEEPHHCGTASVSDFPAV